MKNICIITARGGSKRIPKMNIKDFCGKPIIAYSIEAALKCKIFDEVMVSTDDSEIAEIAINYGAKVPFYRTAETSNDYAKTADVLKEVILEYKKRGQCFDYMCCIYPIAPFITSEKIKLAYDLIIKENADAVNPIVRFSFPPQRAYIIENGSIKVLNQIDFNKRKQDLTPLYHDAGQFYLYKLSTYFTGRDKYKCVPMVINEMEYHDIDTIDAWQIAELKYKIMKQNN